MREHINEAAKNIAHDPIIGAIQRILILGSVPVTVALISWFAAKFDDMNTQIIIVKTKIESEYSAEIRKNDEQDKKIAQILDFIVLNKNNMR